MPSIFLIVASLQLAGDTVTMSVAEAMERALSVSPAVAIAGLQAEAASDRVRQSSAVGNPEFSITAENVGTMERFTGLPGLEGVEGQALIGFSVPLGGDRGARIREARALGDAASATADAVRADATVAIVTTLARAIRDQALTESAREELANLDRLAEALALRAAEGRTSRGEAARADLARAMAATRLARRLAESAGTSAQLTRALGLDPESQVRLTPSICVGPPPTRDTSEPTPTSPEIRAAEAMVRAKEAGVQRARGRRIPDLSPQFGIRRTAGNSGLYLGLATALPLFDRGGAALDAARSEHTAAQVAGADRKRSLEAARRANAGALRALDEAGFRFSSDWIENVRVTVSAAEARYDAGEGTLFELLDSRRARHDAIDDYRTWQTEWWIARAVQARLDGRSVHPSLICNSNNGVDP